MEADLSPADVWMSNGCGSILCDACSKQEAWWAAGGTKGGFIWDGRLSLHHHANRDSSTEPSAPQPDKPPDTAAQQLDPSHYNG